ncbi:MULTISPECIES: hypothetical protein [Streptomyces]|uniref:hypothetical protein n=1 Tax=Streptomyces TaxID=1883 RepID=UPI002276FA8F|nr:MULTISPECIES: hypothetical protein [unclassified Streptomyces]MCY1649260.1 hypothetical protein [Streptomyces sp. SL203]MCY1676973.1 hypothetical protein [Streptomyces sp. SL294]
MPEELTENTHVEELTDDSTPLPGGGTADFVRYADYEERRDKQLTRRKLAFGLLQLVALLAIVPTLALTFKHWTKFTSEDFRELGLIFTPVVALASAAFGFFFASDSQR